MKSGTVAVVGKANAGKSTLINVLVGEKIAIVSPKPQTTRDRILGILTEEESQIVFIDTPGIYKASTMLNSIMQRTTEQSSKEVDLIMLVIDAHDGIKDDDIKLIEKFKKSGVELIVALTKIDIMQEKLLISILSELNYCGVEIIPVSARRNKNLKELKKVILDKLPEGDFLYPEDIISDKSERFMLQEIMREKILLKFDKEIPHGIAIIITEFKERPNGRVVDVSLDIVCEKDNHKSILIGKQGRAIKEVSSFARRDMEKFLGKKVFLTTYIKVKEDWRDSPSLIREYGYKEDKNV